MAQKEKLNQVFNELFDTQQAPVPQEIAFSAEELEQIRLEAISRGEQIIARKKFRNRILYAAAAMLVAGVGVLVIFKNAVFHRDATPAIAELKLPQGKTYQVNDHILAGGLENARLTLQYSDTLEIQLHEGSILINRAQPDSKFILKTKLAQYTPVGTLFALRTGPAKEEIMLGAGEVMVTSASQPEQTILLSADGLRYAAISTNSEIQPGKSPPPESIIAGDIRILQALNRRKIIKPEDLAEILRTGERSRAPQALTPFTESTTTGKTEPWSVFKPGDCVFYFRDSERFQGEVQNVANTGIRIQRGGILEEHIFNPNELTPCR